jgi:hypothetical protein
LLTTVNTISQKFCYRKEALGYAKVIHEKKELKKREKEEMNKIAHVFLQKYFQVSKEICF